MYAMCLSPKTIFKVVTNPTVAKKINLKKMKKFQMLSNDKKREKRKKEKSVLIAPKDCFLFYEHLILLSFRLNQLLPME